MQGDALDLTRDREPGLPAMRGPVAARCPLVSCVRLQNRNWFSYVLLIPSLGVFPEVNGGVNDLGFRCTKIDIQIPSLGEIIQKWPSGGVLFSEFSCTFRQQFGPANDYAFEWTPSIL